MKGSFTKSLFDDEPPGAFTEGHVFVNAPDISGADRDPCLGYWRCDIAHDDELTWSGEVYALFGLPDETPVTREWAVQRYSEQSRRALEHVRTYALKRKLGSSSTWRFSPKAEPLAGSGSWHCRCLRKGTVASSDWKA